MSPGPPWIAWRENSYCGTGAHILLLRALFEQYVAGLRFDDNDPTGQVATPSSQNASTGQVVSYPA